MFDNRFTAEHLLEQLKDNAGRSTGRYCCRDDQLTNWPTVQLPLRPSMALMRNHL